MKIKNVRSLLILISLVLIVAGAIIFYFSILHALDTAWSVMCAPILLDPYCLGGMVELWFVFLPAIIGLVMITFGSTGGIFIKLKLSGQVYDEASENYKQICAVCNKVWGDHSVKEVEVCSNKSQSGNFCENCGNSLKPTTKFCGSCGNQV